MKLKDELTMESLKNARQSVLKMDRHYTHLSIIPSRKLNTFLLTQDFQITRNMKPTIQGRAEALAALEATLKIKKKNLKKKSKVQTDNYAKHMKDLVENKPRTEEDEEIRMNPRCSALLQNHLPPKEQDPGSFILPCSIGKLDFNNALADLGASISVMPLSMYKRLGIGKLKPINMVIKMADNTKCTPKGIVENLLIKIDKFIFPIDFVILDMVEDLRMPIILGRPLLATTHAKESYEEIVYMITEVEKEKQSRPKERRVHWCKAILQEKENKSEYWPSCDPNHDVCDGGDSPINKEKHYWESINDSKREELEWEDLSLNDWMKIRYGKVCKMTREIILKDHWRERFGDKEDDLEENLEDLEECGEDKANAIMGAIHDKLNDDWFNNTSEDEDDLEGILDYLEPRSYDGFIDLDDEAYNKRRTRDNVAAMRARLMEKMAYEGNGQTKT
ncbi:hypothetical protein Tco_1300434 [Tanacetum coccineum]